MSKAPLCIKSDFTDYYGTLSEKSGIIYNRKISDCKQRGADLAYLRKLGIKTLELKQVSSFSYFDDKLVVYTDPKKHNGLGKKICTYDEAMSMYSNYLACKYIEKKDGLTIKYLQVGKRRFTLTFKEDMSSTLLTSEFLKEGRLININEAESAYNRLIGLPIFSIDYISDGVDMIATDFNEVQNLERLGMNRYLKSEEVINEIIEALMVYNKAERN